MNARVDAIGGRTRLEAGHAGVVACAAFLAAPCASGASLSSVVGSASAPANGAETVRVLCPEETVTLGGGIHPANVLTMSVTSSGHVHDDGSEDGARLLLQDDGSGPPARGWQASARNHTDGALSFKAATVCSSAGITTTTEVDSDEALSVFGAPHNRALARAVCPEGTQAIGGGADLGDTLLMQLAANAPFFETEDPALGGLFFQPDGIRPAPIGWDAYAVNLSATSQTAKAGAICSADLSAVTVVGSASVQPDGFNTVRLLCPAGTTAASGGASVQSVATMRVTGSAPVYADGSEDGTVLFFQPDGPGAAPIGWQTAARNDDSEVRTLRSAVICVPEPAAAAQGLAAAVAIALLVRRRRSAAAAT
jgi:hypothetical protein